MKIVLFDCFSGSGGDMILGALIDAGISLKDIRAGLAKLRLKGFKAETFRETSQGIGGTRFHVKVSGGKQSSRNLRDILRLIQKSELPDAVKSNAQAIFRTIGRVEAKIHRVPLARVHFHEIGAVDSIVDIVGACYALHVLKPDKIFFTMPPMGSGWVATEHGKFPVPAPATVALMRGVPVRWDAARAGECLTPTAAAILTHFGTCVQEPLSLIPENVGYGIGTRRFEGRPNALRVVIGSLAGKSSGAEAVWCIQTNIDDMQPQLYGPIMEKLFEAGALDVFLAPIQMKKNRPGILLEALAPDALKDKICSLILQETTSFGVRMHRAERRVLDRESSLVQTALGPVHFKLGRLNGKLQKSTPEFEDCLALARKKGISLAKVYRMLGRIDIQIQ